MKKITSLVGAALLFSLVTTAQNKQAASHPVHICSTMEYLQEDLKKDPSLLKKWEDEGKRQYQAYLQRQKNQSYVQRPAGNTIVIPVVFHIVDDATAQAWITDRDIYEQVEQLNRDYNGEKIKKYKGLIPDEIYNRIGNIPVKFVLARRTPSGALTSGIERRVNTTPNYPNNKSFAAGGLDGWDATKYLNVWAGTFTNGLLGIATFPFTTSGGFQGVTVGTNTIVFASNTARAVIGTGYYPNYNEGATLSHEVGHYFYLWHTFGDNSACNNDDFRIQAGWNLPTGAGPEGDDTPNQKGTANDAFIYGNPSMDYNVGCISTTFGIMYGSYMNYFDDRSLFMFSDGQRKRVEGCINLYRSGLLTTDGATPPVPVTDAFLVKVDPWYLPTKRGRVLNNTPFSATVRNLGTSNLTSVTLNVSVDGGAPTSTVFPVTLAPGKDTTLNLAPLSGAAGNHTVKVYTSAPNGGTDAFPTNDTLDNNIAIMAATATINAPFSESFTSTTFPPTNWQVYNPNGGTGAATWQRSTTSGFTAAGAAYFQNFNNNQVGTLDDLVTPAIDFGTQDSSILSFRVAHADYDATDVSQWDGLEVLVSGDGGKSYNMVYKKTGDKLRTLAGTQTSAFTATPAQPTRWRQENVNLTPYIQAGQKMIVMFRNTTAFGNNTYIDDINVSAFTLPQLDASAKELVGVIPFICPGNQLTPKAVIRNIGKITLTTLKVNYSIDNAAPVTQNWTGSLARGEETTVTFPGITNLAAGVHTLKLFTSAPNGGVDSNNSNDTLYATITVLGSNPLPLVEGFETNTFPGNNWQLQNPDADTTWRRTTEAANLGAGSMVINNRASLNTSSVDKYITPVLLNSSSYDSLFVTFDHSYRQGFAYPGSTAVPLDTLELVVSNDCGATFTTVWKKWGADLQTIADPNHSSNQDPFIPTQKTEWRNNKVFITPAVGSKDFLVGFISKGSQQDNIWIDNINIYGKTLPQRLKDQGYLIYPNPFNSSFRIHHWVAPMDLEAAQIFNAAGQLVWDKRFSGNATTEVEVNMKNLASGVYVLKMIYANKTIVERIVKQ